MCKLCRKKVQDLILNSKMDQEVEFVLNQKGHRTLIHCEYRYTKSKTNKSGSTLWRCVNRSECNASLSLDKTGKIITRET